MSWREVVYVSDNEVPIRAVMMIVGEWGRGSGFNDLGTSMVLIDKE